MSNLPETKENQNIRKEKENHSWRHQKVQKTLFL
jgi:hypothetical protein